MGRAAAVIDVQPVGTDGGFDHFGAEFAEDQRGDRISAAIGAVEHDLQSAQTQVPDRTFRKFDVTAAGVVDPVGLADPVAGHMPLPELRIKDVLFDLKFDVVRQLEAVGGENLDPVVAGRIVAGGDHDAAGGPHRLGQVGDRRSRHRPDRKHIHAHAGQPGGQRIFKHITGNARILAEHDPLAAVVAARSEHQRGGLADQQRELRGNRINIRLAADAIGSKQFFHDVLTPQLLW